MGDGKLWGRRCAEVAESGTCGSETTRGNASPIYQSVTFIDERIWLIFNFDGSEHSQTNQNTTSIRVGIVVNTDV